MVMTDEETGKEFRPAAPPYISYDRSSQVFRRADAWRMAAKRHHAGGKPKNLSQHPDHRRS